MSGHTCKGVNKAFFKAIASFALLLILTGAASATTVTVELPELVGPLEPYPNQPTAAFDLGISFLSINEVRIQVSGTFTPGVRRLVTTGETWDATPEIELYMQRGVVTYLHPLESPFDVEKRFELDLGATWDFLPDGTGEVAAYLGWGVVGASYLTITPGSVEITGAYLKVVNEYREKYKIISQLLENNPQLVSLVHQDLAKMLSQSKRGRKSEYTSEQILRSLIVMFIEQDSFRQVVIRIENSEFLRHFVGLGIKAMMDFSFLDKAFCVLSDRTWETMNRVLAEYAKEQEKISSEKLRLDTTVATLPVNAAPRVKALKIHGGITARRLRELMTVEYT